MFVYCGHIGWLKHTNSVQRKNQGAKFDHHQDKGFRRTCSIALTSTAAGRTLKPVVVGKTIEFGLEGDSGRKLKQLRD